MEVNGGGGNNKVNGGGAGETLLSYQRGIGCHSALISSSLTHLCKEESLPFLEVFQHEN